MVKARKIKNKKRLYIAIGVVVLLAAVIIYFKYFLNFNGVSTELAMIYTKEVKVPVSFFVVRDEEYLNSKESGQTIPLVGDGTRVAENDKIAVICGSETDAANYSEILEIEKDIEYYEQLNSLSGINSVDVESAEKQVRNLFVQALDTVDSGSFLKFDEDIKAFSDKKTRRDIAIKGRMDFSRQLAQLNDRLSALKGKVSNVRELHTETSGFYMGNSDGFENTVKYGDALKLTAQDIENAIAAQAEQTDENGIGRIIKNHKWYLCALMDKKAASELKIGGSYKIILPESGVGKLTFRVEAVNQSDGDQYAVILSGMDTGENIFNLRKGDAQLIRRSYTGYKVPQAAVRTDTDKEKKDDRKFVYILNKTTVVRKDIKIIYSDKDYVLIDISTDKLSTKYVQVYDKIITAGKDLRDGKIIY